MKTKILLFTPDHSNNTLTFIKELPNLIIIPQQGHTLTVGDITYSVLNIAHVITDEDHTIAIIVEALRERI